MSEVRYFGERQRIVFVNLLGESVEVLAGAGGAPTITDGYAKWLRIPRPQRNAVTILEGYEPTTLSVPITFSSTMFLASPAPGSWVRVGSPQNVETAITTLEEMAGLRQQRQGTKEYRSYNQLLDVYTADGKGNQIPLLPPGARTIVEKANTYWVLREQYGPLLTRAGTKTQAEFVGQLLQAAGVESYNPSKKTIQPIAGKEEQELNEQFISTEIERKSATRQVNKQPGVNKGSGLTIEGVPLDRQQLDDLNTALSVAEQEKAGRTATLALLIAGIAESGFRRTAEHKEATQTDMGIWQSDQIPGYEVEKQAAAFLKGGTSFGAGGAIAKAREGKTPGEIAKEVEVSQPPPSFYEKHLPEAEAWLAARGGVGDEGSAGESTGESGESRVGLLHRGSKENPTESSFECITKLAQEVDWYFFTKNDRGYYMSGVDLIRQEPVLYVDVPKNIVRYADGTQAYGALTTRSEKKRNRSASPHQPAVPHLPQPLHLLRLAPESHASSKPPRRR